MDRILARSTGPPSISYSLVKDTDSAHRHQATAIYVSPYYDARGDPRLVIWRRPGSTCARISGVATYQWTSSSITCFPHPDVLPGRLNITLLGTLFSWWLEEQGLPNLHSSALVVREQAVAFLSTNRGGKSTLAATLMQSGCTLLTDDILALEYRGRAFMGIPSYPQMRLWPDEARHFIHNHRELEEILPELSKLRVPVGPGGFGSFATESRPLRCIYLPERHDPHEAEIGIQIRPLSPRDALIELIRHSFSAHTIEAFGFQDRRIDFFARLAQQVPVRRLIYPSGFEHLVRVRHAILDDLIDLR